jgi:putative membrane protein
MHVGRGFGTREVLWWTWREIAGLTVVATAATALHAADLRHVTVPWVLVGLLGTATSFLVGFKNNATYARTWEARTIWGGIVNDSRVFGMLARDLVGGDLSPEARAATHRRLLHRHLAWLTALRHQLREPRVWEGMRDPANAEYRNRNFPVEEIGGDLLERVRPYLSAEEHAHVARTSNKAAQLLALQSRDLAELCRAGAMDAVHHVALAERLGSLVDQQGRCERIKNFPYPRQFATANRFVLWLFVGLVPFALVPEVAKVTTVWLAVPLSVVVTWVFTTLEKVGDATANPFEGSANDVPITAMSRGIEIDLRQLFGEPDVPPPLQPHNDILT